MSEVGVIFLLGLVAAGGWVFFYLVRVWANGVRKYVIEQARQGKLPLDEDRPPAFVQSLRFDDRREQEQLQKFNTLRQWLIKERIEQMTWDHAGSDLTLHNRLTLMPDGRMLFETKNENRWEQEWGIASRAYAAMVTTELLEEDTMILRLKVTKRLEGPVALPEAGWVDVVPSAEDEEAHG